MLTPIQRIKEKHKAIDNKKSEMVSTKDSLHIVKTELERDIVYLKTLNRAERCEYKKEMLLSKWKPKVDLYLDEKKVYQNSIFVQYIIWLFDVQQFDDAIRLGLIAIEQNQNMPKDWKRKLPTFIADTVFEWSEITNTNGHSVEPYFSTVFELVLKWNLHEEIKAKYCKFAGYLLLQDEDYNIRATSTDDIERLEKAKALLEEARKFNIKIGVKTKIDEINARIRAIRNE